MNPKRQAQAGFSLIEVMIASVILIIVLTATFEVLSVGLDNYNSGSTLVEVHAHARRILDRAAKEIQGAGLSTISPTPPATGQTGTHTITFQKSTGYSGGSVQWGNVTTIAFAYETGETDNGADDNNNQIIDEGFVTLTVSGSPLESLGHWVKEDGLSFNLDGSVLTIRVDMQKYSVKGELMETFLETTVLIKN